MLEDFDIEAFLAREKKGIKDSWSDFDWEPNDYAETKLRGQQDMLERLESALKYHRERKARVPEYEYPDSCGPKL